MNTTELLKQGEERHCVLIKNDDVHATLGSVPTQGKKLLEPIKTLSKTFQVPFNILEDKEVLNEAEVHIHEADLWQCIEGEVTFIYGGEMVNPWFKKNKDGTEDTREIKAKEIRGGTTSILKPGDWLWIPAGIPHQHICAKTARLIIIKIPEKK